MAVTPSSQAPSERPAQLAQGRWLGDLAPLSAAEAALVAACGRGEDWEPAGWDDKRPTQATDGNTIRADVIRFLLLGGDAGHPVHEEGVMPYGAWITGKLDLHQARCAARLDAKHCHFVEQPTLLAAHLPELSLSGSRVPGLTADRLKVTGGVFLREDFLAEGEVRLPGAEIGGDFDCLGGSFNMPSGDALSADGLRLTGGLILHDAKVSGAINLAAAQIGTLVDGDLSVWKGGGHIFDGFSYKRIIGVTDAARRIAWLRQQRSDHLTTEFKPQPWEQLIKVLREMGHSYDAGQVAIAKQQQLRKAGKIKGLIRRLVHRIYGITTGYGYHPMRLIVLNMFLWVACSVWYADAANSGIMAPTNAEIIAHRQLHGDLGSNAADAGICGIRGEVEVPRFWPNCSSMPSEYTTFNSVAYSLDLILPLVDLQQERDWAPAVTYTDGRGDTHDLIAGHITRVLMWFEILFGWTASLVLVAVLTRLVEKD